MRPAADNNRGRVPIDFRLFPFGSCRFQPAHSPRCPCANAIPAEFWLFERFHRMGRPIGFAFRGICFLSIPRLPQRARHWDCFIVSMLTVQLEAPWKVGVIGAGVVTSGSHLPVLVNMPEVSVKWICDRSLPTAQRVATSYGISQAFAETTHCPDVDVVLVATPVGSRRSVVPEALSRGWHVFCEKPFALTL